MNTDWQEAQDGENIRVLRGPEAAEVQYLETTQEPKRTQAQKLQDELFEIASENVAVSITAVDDCLDALRVVTEIPARLRGLPVVLGQLQAFVDAERQRKS